MPDLDHLRIAGTTYDLKDSTAREKDAVQDNELSQLNSALQMIARPASKNLLDEKQLLKTGITFSDGVYSGSGSSFAENFGQNTDGLTVFGEFETNQRYTLSCKARNASDAGLTGYGLYIYVLYTDSSYDRAIIYRGAETFTAINLVSAANKTISKYYIAVAQTPAIIWELKEIQIEKGATASTYEPFELTAVDDEASALEVAVNTGVMPVSKEVEWKSGYVSSTGLIRASTVSQFGLVTLHQWESVTVGTQNTNICIIGSTESSNVNVGDTITVIQKTSTVAQYEEYTYTNTNASDINLVLTVIAANYNLSFVSITPIKRNLDDIAQIKTDLVGINDGLYSGRAPIQKDLTLKSGFVDKSTGLIRTSSVSAFCLVQMAAGESVYVTTSSESIAVISETSATSVSVGDTVTPLVTAGAEGESATYSYTALYNTNIVLCFKRDDYTINFYRDTYAYQYGEVLALSIRGASTPPSYYLANNYLHDKAKRINALGKTADDVFTFITDIHWERNAKHSPDLLAYISDRCVIRKLFDGGDVADRGISLSDDTMIDVYKRYRKASGSHVYHVTGNHDWFTPSDGKVLYYGMDSENNDQIGNPFMHYYYFDNVQQKIRYIVLNPFTREAGSSTLTVLYDTDQINWFTNTALDLPTDWDVLVFTHYLRTTTVLSSGQYIEAAIANFNSDESRTGKVLAIFQGHAHWDAVYHTTSGVPVITTTCDKWDLSNESSTIPAAGIAFRELDTKSEQAFDVMVLNRESKTITAVRIGALAQDNVDKYRTDTGFTWVGTLEERVISYAND